MAPTTGVSANTCRRPTSFPYNRAPRQLPAPWIRTASLNRHDVIVLGAGAAGLMCAAVAGQRGRRVLVIDHAPTVGEKIRISGGGRCNFTNLHCSPANFISANPRFCISALRSYTPADFVALLARHGVAWHEKTLGQLFCDDSAQNIIDVLLAECAAGGVEFRLATCVQAVTRDATGHFVLDSPAGAWATPRLVVATGGLSIPKIGASGFAYDLARHFDLAVVAPRPGLVPLVFGPHLKAWTAGLSGVALDVEVRAGNVRFGEALLFTHRGLSGPAVLQASSYWEPGGALDIDLAPGSDAVAALLLAKRASPRQQPGSVLASLLPRSLAQRFAAELASDSVRLADLPDARLRELGQRIAHWRVVPDGSEGFRKAEVTVGGVDTHELGSRDMQARRVPGLFFIGEAVDVTGHLGGHNFQWAWSSAQAAGRAL